MGTVIESAQGGGLDLETVHAGGLCGIATPMDPVSTKADELSGQVMAKIGELPPIWSELKVDLELLKFMVSGSDEGSSEVRPLQPNEMLMINSATTTSVGTVSSIKGRKATITLRLPICAKEGSRITLSRRIGTRWRLIGHGSITG
jgi:translation initiation factor 2 subunit 3